MGLMQGDIPAVAHKLQRKDFYLIGSAVVNYDGDTFLCADPFNDFFPCDLSAYPDVAWMLVFSRFLRILAYREPEDVTSIFPCISDDFEEDAEKAMALYGDRPFGANPLRLFDLVAVFPNDVFRGCRHKAKGAIAAYRSLPAEIREEISERDLYVLDKISVTYASWDNVPERSDGKQRRGIVVKFPKKNMARG